MYIIKPDIIGAAVRMQGYDARDGFGITRIKNHTVDTMPIIIKLTFEGILCLRKLSNNLLNLFGMFFIK